MDDKIILNYNNLGLPESWFHYPDNLDDSDFQTSINIFENEIGNGFKFNKKMYLIFENVKKFHVFFFPILKKDTSNECKIKILSAMVVLWLFIIDDYYEETITKENCNEMININLKLINILIKPDNHLKDELSNNEIITKVIKNYAFGIIKDENSLEYNYFISSIYQYISSSIAYYTLNNPTYPTYSELRVMNSGVLMIESTYLLHFINYKNEKIGCGGCDEISNNDLIFLNDSRYTRLKSIHCLVVCIHNDIFSSENEKENEQHVNSFWIEYKSNNGNLNKTFDSLLNKVKDYVNQFNDLELSLIKSYSNNNYILNMMIKALKYTMTGNILLSINTNRYINNNNLINEKALFIKGNENDAYNLKN